MTVGSTFKPNGKLVKFYIIIITTDNVISVKDCDISTHF